MLIKRRKNDCPVRYANVSVVNALNQKKGVGKMECIVCKGKKKLTSTCTKNGTDIVEQFEYNCIRCDGTGEMTLEQLQKHEDFVRISKQIWCDKENCTFASYPQYGECECGVMKEHVHCQHGKIIQIG